VALRILRGEISRTPHSFSGHAVCPLRSLRQPRIAAHRGGACPGPGIRHWPASRIAGVSLRALPQQILLPEATPARRKERSGGLEPLKVFENPGRYHVHLRPRSMEFCVLGTAPPYPLQSVLLSQFPLICFLKMDTKVRVLVATRAFLRKTSLDELPQFFNVMNVRAELSPTSAPLLNPPSYLLTNTREFFAVLCFHALTHCPICKSFVLISIPQWGCGVPPSSGASLLLP
jgi:Bacterial sugar transferase